MPTFKYSLLIIVLIIFSSLTAGQVSKTLISDIKIDNIKISRLNDSEISIKSNQSISFYFNNTFPDDAPGEEYYKVFLNNKLFVSKLASNFIILQSLSAGEYIIHVQAFKGNSFEAVAVNKKFIVKSSRTNNEKTVDVSESSLSILTIVFAGISFLLLIVVVVLLKNRNTISYEAPEQLEQTSHQVEPEPEEEEPALVDAEVVEIIHDPNEKSEYEKLQESNNILKRGYKRLEEENDQLRKNINLLNKTIQSLEEANINLIEQKESLVEKKLTLEDLQQQKDELLAIKFHDIKNPAQAIQGLVSLLESYDLTAMEQQEIMESIIASSSNIVNLVQAITETFANQNFDDEYIMSLSSLQDVISAVVKINLAYAKKKQVRLLDNSSKSMPKFEFDAQKIKEVLDNLINNAIKFSPPKTDVTVRSFITETHAVTEVKDNGVGMTSEDLSIIFQKGVKLSAKPTGGEKSSGLGLWIAKKIVEAHDGEITVESKQGIGSKFVFKLPFNNSYNLSPKVK